MYTATIINKGIKEGQLYITVEYSNGADTYQQIYWYSKYSDIALQGVVQTELTRLNTLIADTDKINIATLQTVSETPLPAPTPIVAVPVQ